MESPCIASLYKALLRNPFVHQGLDRLLLAIVYDAEHGRGGWEWDTGPDDLGWLAYTEGKFAEANRRFAQALVKHPDRVHLRQMRARGFQHMQQYDSVTSELAQIVRDLEQRDRKHLRYFYESKAVYLYSMGLVYSVQKDYLRAREALGQALSEDLAFYMAHAALGTVALAQGDTATALSEYEQAVQLNAGDPVLRYNYGVVLTTARHLDDAAAQYRTAIELEPYFANSYLGLGSVFDARGMKNETIEQYTQFLARAPLTSATQIAAVKQRLLELGTVPPGNDE